MCIYVLLGYFFYTKVYMNDFEINDIRNEKQFKGITFPNLKEQMLKKNC